MDSLFYSTSTVGWSQRMKTESYDCSASRLLGAEVVLVGVAPEVAQTIVTLGLDLGGLRSAADLRSAVEEILARHHSVRKRVDHP